MPRASPVRGRALSSSLLVAAAARAPAAEFFFNRRYDTFRHHVNRYNFATNKTQTEITMPTATEKMCALKTSGDSGTLHFEFFIEIIPRRAINWSTASSKSNALTVRHASAFQPGFAVARTSRGTRPSRWSTPRRHAGKCKLRIKSKCTFPYFLLGPSCPLRWKI